MKRSLLLLFTIAACALCAVTPHSGYCAQEKKTARVSFVDPQSASTSTRGVSAFWKQLSGLGWVEGRNLVKEQLEARGDLDRLSELMKQAASRRPDVIVTVSTPGALAARRATSTIPIVVGAMGDPVGSGLAASLAHPGGNVTGLSLQFSDGIAGKWLELLKEAIPTVTRVAVFANPASALQRQLRPQLEASAAKLGLGLTFIDIATLEAIDSAFERARPTAQAGVVIPDPLLVHNRARFIRQAELNRMPVVYGLLEFVDAGGLMSYGVEQGVLMQRAAHFVDKILRGASPAELPIEQPTQFALAINLKAAKALGIKMPESIMIRADEVIR